MGSERRMRESQKGVSSNNFRRGVAQLANRKAAISAVSQNPILKFKGVSETNRSPKPRSNAMPATKQMTVRSALTEARKRWGSDGVVQDTRRPSSPEQRQAAAAEWEELRAREPKRPTEGDRQGERQGPEWEAYRVAKREWNVARDSLLSQMSSRRYLVGVVWMGMAFMVRGQGDTWQEAFDAAKGK